MKKFLPNYQNIFLVGICGSSMTNLALLLKYHNKKVSGSDANLNDNFKILKENKINVFLGHKASHIKGFDLVVFSGAISKTNEEVIQAKKDGIKIMERSEFLYEISKFYKHVIAISGTHGKTTISALLGYIFMLAGKKPTIHIGGTYLQEQNKLYAKYNNFFITEACEFRNSFLFLKPEVSLINNIEREHLDYFKTFKNEVNSFKIFAKNTKKTCYVPFNLKKTFGKSPKIKYFNDEDIYAAKIRFDEEKTIFDLVIKKKIYKNIKLNLMGKYNVLNAVSAICIALKYKINFEIIRLALNTFQNVERRMQSIGLYKKTPIIHDYAHHPTEIKNVIKVFRDMNKKVVCVFQPHTFSRTKIMINDFVNAFAEVDVLVLLPTFSARETYDYEGSSEFLFGKILKQYPDKKIIFAKTKKESFECLKNISVNNSTILFLGAGNIYSFAKDFVKIEKII